jgi:hypothetical protein
MRSLTRLLQVLTIICAFLVLAQAATYYVNGSTGDDTRTKAQAQSSSTPWQTVQTGADSAVAGDVVEVAAGTYSEVVQISGTDSVSERLTIRGADPDNRPVMDGDSSKFMTRAFALIGDQHVTIENFEIKDYFTHGVQVFSGSHHAIIRNCYIHHCNKCGVSAENSRNLTVDSCLILGNSDNGIGFTKSDSLTVRHCEITLNMGEAGIWIGGGTSGSFFMTSHVVLQNNYIHHQPENPHHADNIQLHQVEDIWLENNVFIQDGQQNMWCQYTKDYHMHNNIFMGGPLGINSCMYSYLYHNAFYKCTLRYDAHLTNHPDFGAYYAPIVAMIRNNLIIESGIAMPSVGDKNRIFTVDNNYFNSTSSWTRQNWGADGVGIGDNSIQHTSPAELTSIITTTPNAGYTTYDFRPVTGSWLIDRAWPVPGLETDHTGQPRAMGGIPDVGPHEYYTTDIKGPAAANALPRIIRYQNPARAQVILQVPDAGRVMVCDVTGKSAAEIKVRNGQAVLRPAALGLRDGMYILRDGSGTILEKLILTK